MTPLLQAVAVVAGVVALGLVALGIEWAWEQVRPHWHCDAPDEHSEGWGI